MRGNRPGRAGPLARVLFACAAGLAQEACAGGCGGPAGSATGAAGSSAGAGTALAAPPAPDAWRALELAPSLVRLLETGEWDETPAAFRIVTLSMLADGCAAGAGDAADPADAGPAHACVARAHELAERTREAPLDLAGAGDDLWWTHYNLILGASDRVGPCGSPERHRALSAALAERSLREPTRHVPSWRGRPHRFPADQTATLASLARFDRAHAGRLAEEPIRAWRSFVLEHAFDAALGLPWSEVTGEATGARDPRGCALSWQTRYLVEYDPALAAAWWERYKEHYLVDRVVLVGFREWPPGRDRPADGDSGPIVEGVGAAATALAIAAARAMDDDLLAARLEATGSVVAAAAETSPELRRHAHTALADAILFVGEKMTAAGGRK